MKPIFFKSQAELRAWFTKNHATKTELFVGFYKAKTGKKAFTWSEAVDEALCVGWIDGQVHPIDETMYAQRFTPRRAGSTWSNVNVAKVAKLTAEGRMLPAGTKAFEARTDAKTGIYSFEQEKESVLPPAMAKRFRANKAAWAYFSARPPWYRRAAIHWVTSAKQDETKQRRLQTLIDDSAAGVHIKLLRR